MKLNNRKSVLFIPSNENHVRMFSQISRYLKTNYDVVFISQEPYKKEGVEKILHELGINFKRLDDYDKKNPESILKKENASIVIIGNDTDVIPQWFVNCAKKMKIHTVLVQDGVLLDIKTIKENLLKKFLFLIIRSNIKFLVMTLRLVLTNQYHRITYGLGGCTQIHVWGETSKTYLINKKIDSNRIVIVGNIKMDERKDWHAEDKNEKIVLYAPTDLVSSNVVTPKTMHELTADLCSAITSLENMKLVIKPHPRENMEFYENLITAFGNKIEISTSDIPSLLGMSKLVISDLSTVTIESLVINKPVIIYMPNIENIVDQNFFPHDLISKNAVLFANNKQSLLEQVAKILNGKWLPSETTINKIKEEYLGILDHCAALRSSEFITKLLS